MQRPIGSSWWKVDFHAHSPASFDFGGVEGSPRSERSVPVTAWLQSYMDAKVDVVVITDHNTGDGIEPARAALQGMRVAGAEDFRELTLLPGVELTVNGGYHLLAVFDVTADETAIDRLLHRCDYRGDRGDSNGTTEKTLEQSIKEIVADGGIPIPAHIETSGYLDLDARSRSEIEAAGIVIAVEATAEGGTTYANKRNWAAILGSDGHHLDGSTADEGVEAKYPGSHFTWVKMQEPNLHGLKLALSDPEFSIKRSTEVLSDPNETLHSVVRTITVRRGSEEFVQELSPWMNAVIGGRGVGKSTMVELLRLAMGRFSELPDRLQRDQSWFSDQTPQSGEDRYWDDATTISVDYEKLGQSFRIEWSGTTRKAKVFVRTGANWEPDVGSPSERFPILAYSQKQIYETAQDPQFLLRMIDKSPSIGYADWASEFDRLGAEYRAVRSEIQSLDTVLQAENRMRGELSDLTTQVDAVAARLSSPDIAELEQLIAEEARDRDVDSAAVSLEASLTRALEDVGVEVQPTAPADDLEPTQNTEGDEEEVASPIGGWGPFEARQDAIDIAIASVRASVIGLAASRDALAEEDWNTSPRAARIAVLRASLGEPDADDDLAETHSLLSERKSGIERALSNIGTSKDRRSRLLVEAAALLLEIRAHRHLLTERRKAFTKSISGPVSKLNVFELGDEEGLEGDLRELWNTPSAFDAAFAKGSGLRAGLPHPQNPLYSEAVDRLKDALKDLRANGAASAHATSGFIGQLEGRLFTRLESVDAFELETAVGLWFPEDRLQLRYSQDGGAFQDLEQASPGQKTTALLTVILQLGDDPLILDQPEDDLDNKLISDLVVKALRRNKGHRQVIVVTHNANVVVNGDAELVVVMKGNLPVPTAEIEGTIQLDAVKDAICLILEGGEPAFAARYRRLIAAGVLQ